VRVPHRTCRLLGHVLGRGKLLAISCGSLQDVLNPMRTCFPCCVEMMPHVDNASISPKPRTFLCLFVVSPVTPCEAMSPFFALRTVKGGSMPGGDERGLNTKGVLVRARFGSTSLCRTDHGLQETDAESTNHVSTRPCELSRWKIRIPCKS
jgi:hypothetical protein